MMPALLCLTLLFAALCLIGLVALIRQAMEDPGFAPTGMFLAPAAPAPPRAPTAIPASAATSSEDAEGGACSEGCA